MAMTEMVRLHTRRGRVVRNYARRVRAPDERSIREELRALAITIPDAEGRVRDLESRYTYDMSSAEARRTDAMLRRAERHLVRERRDRRRFERLLERV